MTVWGARPAAVHPSTRYLITGGAGFIGSHLAEALLARGYTVTILDNLTTGALANIRELERDPAATFVVGSVLDAQLLDELVESTEVVIHLAAAVGVKLVVEQPLRSLITNIRGCEHVIEAAHRYRRKLFIASSSEVYGKNGSGPLPETADSVIGAPSLSRWGYSMSKAVDEYLAIAYWNEKGLPSVIGRFFNTVGPRQSPAYGMVIPRLVSQALRGDDLTVFGDGTQTRCFCHVIDVVDAVLRLIDDPRAHGEAFNIGSSEEVSIAELAERVLRATGSSSRITFIPYDRAYGRGFEDMQRRVPNTEKLRRLTGWTPTRSLDQIIDSVVEHARSTSADARGDRTGTPIAGGAANALEPTRTGLG